MDPKKDPYDLIKIFAIEAGGFSIVAKDLETAKIKGSGCKFYLDNLKETVATRTSSSKIRNKALASLQDLYDTNPTKLRYVAKVIDVNQGYKNSTPNDVIYEDMDAFIHGEGSEPNKTKAAAIKLVPRRLSKIIPEVLESVSKIVWLIFYKKKFCW